MNFLAIKIHLFARLLWVSNYFPLPAVWPVQEIFSWKGILYTGGLHKNVFALNLLTYFSSKRFSQSSLAALAVFQSFSLKFPRLKYPLQQSQNHRQIPDFIDSEDTITLQDLDDDFVTIEVDSLILGISSWNFDTLNNFAH